MSIASDQPLLVNQLPIAIDFPKDANKFHETITLLYKRIANATNTKTGGLYNLTEQSNFNQFYNLADVNTFRNVYRKTFDLVQLNGGNIPGGAVLAFPHGITGIKYATLIYASCTSITPAVNPAFFTVMYPYATMDRTNIYFTNPTATILTSVIFVAEYMKT